MSTILLIDDDAQFRRLVGTVLRGRGHTLFEAPRLAAADRLLADLRFDLVLCDGLLPDGDGASWIVRKRAAGFDTPLVFVTAFWRGHRDVEDLRKRSSAIDVLQKPISPDELGRQVDRVLGRQIIGRGLSADERADLERLRCDYAAGLPQELEELRRAILQARVRPNEVARLERAHQLAHRIAGTAGSLGFDGVGDSCARVEQGFVCLRDGALQREAWAAVDEGMRSALASLNEDTSACAA